MKARWILMASLWMVACNGATDPDPGAADGAPAGSAEFSGCAENGTASLWNVSNLHGPIASMALSDLGVIAVGSDDGSVKQWTIGMDGATAPLPGGRPSYGDPFVESGAAIGTVAFADGPGLVLAGDASGRASVWRMSDVGLDSSESMSESSLVSLDARDDQVALVDTSFAGNVRIWDRNDNTTSAAFTTDLWGVTRVAFDGVSSMLLAGDDYGEPLIERHDTSDGSQGAQDSWIGSPIVASIRDFAVTADSERVVVAADGFVAVLDAGNLSAGPTVFAELDGISSLSVAVSPTGSHAATIGDDGILRLWNTADLTLVASSAVTDPIAVEIDASGQRMIVAGRDGRVSATGCAQTQP